MGKLILITVVVICNVIDGDTLLCSERENLRWSKVKGRCVQCRPCKPGNFRNYTEQWLKDQITDRGCIRCQTCPTGTYSVDGSECRPCMINCTDLHREYDQVCSRTADSKCGSCINGYEEVFGNTVFPCKPRSKPSSESTSVNTQSLVRLNSSLENISIQLEHPIEAISRDDAPWMTIKLAIVLVVIAVISAISSVFLVIFYRKRHRKATFRQKENVILENDIETDGAYKQTEQQIPLVELNLPRPELERQNVPYARGEISASIVSEPSSNCVYFRFSIPDNRAIMCYTNSKVICQCFNKIHCRCKHHLTKCKDMLVTDSDIVTIAVNICHNPIDFFKHLGLEDCVIYQEDDSRNRDPERISQKEFVINLFKIWRQRRGEQPKLALLIRALCLAKFHGICDKIMEVK